MLYFILRDYPEHLEAFLKAQVAVLGKDTPYVGLAGTAHETKCREAGVPFVPEVFVDIDYDPSGKLLGVPQSKPPTPEIIAQKLERMIKHGESRSPCRWNIS